MTLGTTCTGSRRCGCVGCHDARYAAGYEAAVRDFWRGVCEQRAKDADKWAAGRQRHAAQRRGYVTSLFGQYELDWMAQASGRLRPGVNDSARQAWDQGQTLLAEIANLYAEARGAANVGRQLRAWAAS